MISEPEVLVVGGGPTGCVIATTLAHQGHQVMLASDERREGGLPVETMVPGASTTLERLGLTDAIGNCAIDGPPRHGRCWSRSDLEIEDLDELTVDGARALAGEALRGGDQRGGGRGGGVRG